MQNIIKEKERKRNFRSMGLEEICKRESKITLYKDVIPVQGHHPLQCSGNEFEKTLRQQSSQTFPELTQEGKLWEDKNGTIYP